MLQYSKQMLLRSSFAVLRYRRQRLASRSIAAHQTIAKQDIATEIGLFLLEQEDHNSIAQLIQASTVHYQGFIMALWIFRGGSDVPSFWRRVTRMERRRARAKRKAARAKRQAAASSQAATSRQAAASSQGAASSQAPTSSQGADSSRAAASSQDAGSSRAAASSQCAHSSQDRRVKARTQ